MSISIYAGKLEDFDGSPCWGPVIDFKCWQKTVLADDAEDRADRDEDPFITNPLYQENAGMSLANANARRLLDIIGFDIGEEGCAEFPIDVVQKAAMRGLNGKAADHTELNTLEVGSGGATMIAFGLQEGQMKSYLERLLALITTGRQLGATHLICA